MWNGAGHTREVIPHAYSREAHSQTLSTSHTKTKAGDPYAVTITSPAHTEPQPRIYETRSCSPYGDKVQLSVNRLDHETLISQAPNHNHPSSDPLTMAYHMDPVSFSADHGYQGNNRFFQSHANNIQALFPSEANAGREAGMGYIRLIGRRIINARFMNNPLPIILSSKMNISVKAIENTAEHGGLLGKISSQHITRVYDSYRKVSPPAPHYKSFIPDEDHHQEMCESMVIVDPESSSGNTQQSHFAHDPASSPEHDDEQFINARLRAEQACIAQLMFPMSQVLHAAAKDRDAFLAQAPPRAANETKKAIVKNWDRNDALILSYLNRLSNIKKNRDSPIQDIVESGTTAASHQLKIGLIAEKRLMRQLRSEIDSTSSTTPITRAVGAYVNTYVDSIHRYLGT
jgi:hypothetical protein